MKPSKLVIPHLFTVFVFLSSLPSTAAWIDKTGSVIKLPTSYSPELPKASDGLTLFGESQGDVWFYGYKNKDGNIAIPAKFLEAGRFANGVAPVFFQSRWTFIDKSGRTAITLPPGCSFAGAFSEGVAAFVLRAGSKLDDRLPKSGDRLGYIDLQGHIVIPAKYRFVFPRDAAFSNGLAAVVPGDAVLLSYGYINHEGEWAIKPRFAKAGVFHDGKAMVTVGEQEFLADSWIKHDKTTPFVRERQFQIFLSSHNLLGMSSNDVEKFLGPPDSTDADEATYRLESSSDVQLHYENGVVAKYRYRTRTVAGNWIDQSHPDHSELSQYFI